MTVPNRGKSTPTSTPGSFVATQHAPTGGTDTLVGRPDRLDSARVVGEEWLNGPGADWLEDISDPDTANGLCTDVSEDFAAWASAHGYDAECLDLSDEGPHTVVVLHGDSGSSAAGGVVVDFTRRQFDPGCDIPHVEPLDTYLGVSWEITYRWRPGAPS